MIKNRIRKLNAKRLEKGRVIYWMSRDQRVEDNWALIAAQQIAISNQSELIVVFNLLHNFLNAPIRHFDFMLNGLVEEVKKLEALNIGFELLYGDPAQSIPTFISQMDIKCLVSDFSPLKINREWKEKIKKNIQIPFYEVDAHNIVPVWIASPKQEFGAYTLRPKINRLLSDYLDHFPKIEKMKDKSNYKFDYDLKVNDLLTELKLDHSVKKVDWVKPGSKAASVILYEFIDERLEKYDEERNDPNANAQSNLSPYLHYGQISAQRVALKINTLPNSKSKDSFLEELIIRRELSDNYCFYNDNYDNSEGFPDWAKKTHAEHENNTREFVYSLEDLENAKTHDPLWNAAEMEMVIRGKMHGYMRMYWAKKILEWTENVQTAQKYTVFLNDKYFLDGRDPNGYVGIAWSLGGLHDRAWFDRPVFGKIRYMNFNGAKKKFNVEKYINLWTRQSNIT